MITDKEKVNGKAVKVESLFLRKNILNIYEFDKISIEEEMLNVFYQ